MVSAAAQGLEAAISCREGSAEFIPRISALRRKEEGAGIARPPRTPRRGTLTLTPSFRKSPFEDGAARLVAAL